MRGDRVRAICVLLAMIIAWDALFLRSALIVVHDHWFGVDGVGAAVHDTEPYSFLDDQPILDNDSHGTLVTMKATEQQRPRGLTLCPSPVSAVFITTAARAPPSVTPAPENLPASDRHTGLRRIVLRI